MCGIIAIKNHPDAARLVRLGLHNLQHRGEESVGIASSNGENIFLTRKMGLVGEAITESECSMLLGNMAIGQVRYSTEGKSVPLNIQPLYAKLHSEEVAITHNGHIARASGIREKLERNGSIFQTTTDTEILLHLMARSKHIDSWNKLQNALDLASGAYSIALLTNDDIIVARDKCGIRPLILGKLGDAIIASSESCAIEFLGGKIIRDVEAGEQLRLIESSLYYKNSNKNNICVFEYVYFARPDSEIQNISIHNARIRLGEQLAIEHPVEADLCIAVPDSGREAAIGYSRQSGIPYDNAILRTHYAGRSFIQPEEIIRNSKIRMKLNPVTKAIEGKSLVVVDDSLVRSNTARQVVQMLKKSGAKDVHVRISSPPVKFPCYYGIDIRTKTELIAASHSVEEIRDIVKCESLKYLSYKGMVNSIGVESCCDACFSGRYLI